MATKTYQLTKRHKLIDLNGENVNFKLEFIVQALNNNDRFKAIVLTQEQLDSVDLNKIEMKSAEGKISGNITANNNKYQNYFLVLKKHEDDENDNELPVEILINLEKISDNDVKENFNNQKETGEVTNNVNLTETTTTSPNPLIRIPFYKKPWFWLLIVILVAVVGLVYYNYFYLKKPFFWQKPKINNTSIAPSSVIKQEIVAPIPSDANTKLYERISNLNTE